MDVFAYGSLLWEILHREVPYYGLEPIDIKAKVESGENLKVAYGTDPRIVSLVADCRSPNPALRPSFERVIEIINLVIR